MKTNLIHAILPANLLARLEQPGGAMVRLEHVPGGGLSWLAAELEEAASQPLVLVTGKTSRAEAIYRELLFFTRHRKGPLRLLPFPAWETLPFDRLSPFGPLVAERIASLFRLTQMQGVGPVSATDEVGHARGIIITTPMAIMQRVMPKKLLIDHGFSIAQGDQLDLAAFQQYLVVAGYRSVPQIEEAGEFSVRGGIVDFFPPEHEEPVRLELFGDEVETLRLFDVLSQRSTDRIAQVKALPVSEVILTDEAIRLFRTHFRHLFGGEASEDPLYKAISMGQKTQGMEHFLPLFYDHTETLFDYVPKGTPWLLDEDVMAAMATFEAEIQQQHVMATEDGAHTKRRFLSPDKLYLSVAQINEKLQLFPVIQTHRDAATGAESMGFAANPDFAQEARLDAAGKSALARAHDYISHARRENTQCCVVTRTMGQQERLREMLMERKIAVRSVNHWADALALPTNDICLVIGDLDSGFAHTQLGVLLLTEDEILGTRIRRRQTDQRYLDRLLASFADLKEQDLVVHTDYGIGRFGGLHSLTVGEIKNEFLLVRYADADKLYVPVENLDRVSKYAGADAGDAILDKLGGTKWVKTKTKAKKKILEMAAELVALQAQRQAEKGFQFSGVDALYQEFAAAFPFEETPDQAQTIEAVLTDMASVRPMDRLVCGDVGFGKTEVAIRATFRAVMDGKQVAILAPTTILTQQHYETFSRRLAPYPVKVVVLSRFRTPREQKIAITDIAEGRADVVIGTHRLLQKDIVFKDLGLLVVDEEQRFGVTHKERIKKLRATVDILTLTATPIPRTLHMAMAGIRDISIIATPPADRLSIRTFISEYKPSKVREAVLREIYRGGQVFFLYNKVQDIDKMAARLMELVPEAKIGVAHGQLREGQLEKIMLAFYRQEFNLLLCTTIIENGVDIPTANTIIIYRADRFGLAQLHQLRGRVGRSKHRAYAYLFVPHEQAQTSHAKKRLEAIESLGELGAGFMLATHDLEIRGAGNILGDDQSGQIKEVGYELYNHMLKEAIAHINAADGDPKIAAEEEIVPNISLHLSTQIPSDFVPDVHLRLNLYKRIAELNDQNEIDEMRVELTDRFGSLPSSVDHLLKVVAIKRLCRIVKILKVEAGPKGAVFSFHPEPKINPEALIRLIRQGGGSVIFNQENRSLHFRERNWEDAHKRLNTLKEILEALVPPKPTQSR